VTLVVTADDGTVIETESCQPGETAPVFMYGAFEYVKLVSYSLVPFVVILTLNVAIVIRLRRSTPLRRGPTTPTAVSVPLIRVTEFIADDNHLRLPNARRQVRLISSAVIDQIYATT